MSWEYRWAVMVPGELSWVERRTREILEEIWEGLEVHYSIIPGQGHYQAIVQEGEHDRSPEVLLGHALSLECEEPVYSIEGVGEFSCIWCHLKGEELKEDREPDELVRALGCVMPWDNEPLLPRQRLVRTVVLIQGLSKARVLDALEKQWEGPLPTGYHCLQEVPQGLILRDGTGELTLEDIELAQRFPRATLYAVTAKPDLTFFLVCVRHHRKSSEFLLPPREFPLGPVLDEVLGERTPERILAALGMSKEWFQL